MNDIEIVAQRDHIKYLFSRASSFHSEPELLSHWSKYICVLTSGYLENALRHYFSEFSKNKSHPFITNYVSLKIKDFMNPNMEKILILTGSFNKDWKESLETFVNGERKDAIDSIVANRNGIAHGRHIGLTLARMKTYFDRTSEVIEFIKDQIKSEM